MSNYIEYLDLPQIPTHLIESLDCILAKKDHWISTPTPYFLAIPIDNVALDMWLKTTLNCKFFASYQVIYTDVPIHKDVNDRQYAYNYVIESGGLDVKTIMYSDELEVIQSEQIQPNRWHRLQTNVNHAVRGVEPSNVRILLSITTHDSINWVED